MIQSIHLQNFFSFKDQTIELGPANFMVGINGSGKSNLIKALRLLKAALTEGELEELIINRWGGFDAVCFKGLESEKTPSFSLEFVFDPEVFRRKASFIMSFFKVAGSQNFTISERFVTNKSLLFFRAKDGIGYAIEREGAGQEKTIKYQLDKLTDSMLSQLMDTDRYPVISALRKAISDISIYQYFDTTENSPIRRAAPSTSATRLVPDGSNLPQLLNWLNLNFKKEYKAVKQSLNAINPNITDINFHLMGTNIELLLEEDALDSSVHVAHVSDGTLRFLCLMAILHNPKRGRLICIDEPEVGLHPDMICEIMKGFEDVSEDTQFLITTHSELVLNHATIDNVIVCEKDGDNATCIRTFRTDEYKEWAADYSTGNLWRNGDLGGNRY